jgi:hypothetical protein
VPNSRAVATATILGGLACILLLDSLLFRTNLYLDWLAFESSTGIFEARLKVELARQKEPGNLVVTLGNSRFAYLPRVANHYTSQSGYTFRHAGIAGTSARDWYYMLRDLDPTARRYQAIVIGFEDLEDEDSFSDRGDDPRSLHYVVARLRLTDLPEYAQSHRTFPIQWAAFRGGLLKGTALQSDVHDFLLHPRERIANVQLNRRGWAGWTYDYDEEERSLAGLTIDWNTRQITLPPGADPVYRKMFNETLLRPPAPATGHIRQYHRQWIGRIVDRYRDSPTRIVFIRLPRGPLSPQTDVPLNPQSSLRQLANPPKVFLGQPLRYAELERPDYFKDPLHLNRAGAHAFSRMLVDEVRELIGPPLVTPVGRTLVRADLQVRLLQPVTRSPH